MGGENFASTEGRFSTLWKARLNITFIPQTLEQADIDDVDEENIERRPSNKAIVEPLGVLRITV